MTELKRTVLFEKHQALNAKCIDFGGWYMPVQYEGILKEHAACRNGAAIFDISHMGEFFFKGDITFSGVNKATTVDVVKLPVGKCKYGFLLNGDGGVIDDMIIYKPTADKLMFVVNASRIDVDFKTIEARLSSGTFVDASSKTAKIDIQGPTSKEILQKLVPINLDKLKFFSFVETTILETNAIVSRTGYTGEHGYELYLDNDVALLVWDELVKGGAVPAGLGARDVLRLEVGYSLYGHELDENTSPIEAGVGSFVGYDKYFIGKEALLQQKEEGAPKQSISFTTNTKQSPRADMEIYQNDQKIGVVTSGTFSPSINSGIGLGSVQTKLYDKDLPLEIRTQRGSMPIFLATLPFYKKK